MIAMTKLIKTPMGKGPCFSVFLNKISTIIEKNQSVAHIRKICNFADS